VFTNILFLLFALFIVNLAPEINQEELAISPISGFLAGIGLYLLVLAIIFLQNILFLKRWRWPTARLLILANIELIAFLLIFHFVLAAQRIWTTIPSIADWQILPTLFSLSLYFGGLAVFHYTSNLSKKGFVSRQLCFLLPFILPFITYILLMDLLWHLPIPALHALLSNPEGNSYYNTILTIASLAFLIMTMIFLPFIIQWLWQCQPLEDQVLLKRLQGLCKRAHFKYAEIKTWTILNNSVTAAIIGIVPRFRYVMFTQGLLDQLPPEQIEAVLAHEIGHSKHKHLLIYPLIMAGLIVTISIISSLFSQFFYNFFVAQNLTNPSFYWSSLYLIFIFLFYALIIASYGRIVFGYFSRLFERQADLTIFSLDIPPEHLIAAFDNVAKATGHSHRRPNWHHYSIQDRIDFLHQAINNPKIIKQHHQRVRRNIIGYLCLLAIGILLVFIIPT